MFINKDTISTIHKTLSGTFILTVYENKKIIFQKEYNSFRIARMIETRKIKKYILY